MVETGRISDPRLRTAQQRIDIRRQELFEDTQIRNEAKRLDQEFRRNLVGDIKELEKQYKNIPENLRNAMEFNLDELKQVQQERIDRFEREIELLNRDIKRSIERQRTLEGDRFDRERATEDQLLERSRVFFDALVRTQAGELLDFNDVRRFAIESAANVRDRSLQQAQIRREQEQITSQLEKGLGTITQINYETGRVTVDGQSIQLTPDQVKNLQLTSVRNVQLEREGQKIISKIDEGKNLTKADYDKLKKLGFSIDEVKRYEQDLKKYNELQKKIENIAKTDNVQNLRNYLNINRQFLLNNLQQDLKRPQSLTGTLTESKLFKDYKLSDKFITMQQRALRGDKTPQAIIFGIAATGTILVEDAIDLGLSMATGLINTIKNPKEKVEAAINFFSNIDNETIKNIQKATVLTADELGRGLQQGTPEAMAVVASFALSPVPVRVPIPTKLPKVLRLPTQRDKNRVDKAIEALKEQGVNIRDRTPQGEQLRYLTDLNRLETDVRKLDKLIISNNKLLKPKILKKPNSAPAKQVKKNIKEFQNIPKLEKQISKLSTTANKITKGDIKKAEALRDLYDRRIVEKIKVIKKLPTSEKELNKLLLDARAISGTEFARLKKRIKKEQGKNVVERKVDGKVSYKILDPKEQRKKGVVTGKKAKPKEIKLIPKEQKKIIDVTEEVAKRPTVAQLDKLEKEIGKQLKKAKKKGLFQDKKAQVQIQKSFSKMKNNIKKTSQKISKGFQKYRNDYQKIIAQNKKTNTQRIERGQKAQPIAASVRRRQNRVRSNLIASTKAQIKTYDLYLSVLGLLGVVEGLKPLQDAAQKQNQDLKNWLKELQEMEIPTKPVKPKKKPKTKPVKKPKKPVDKPKKPVKKLIKITDPKKLPEKPKIPARRIRKPVKPKKPVRFPRIRKADRSKQMTRLGEISYIITNPRTKKRDVIRIRTGLPYNEAKEIAKQVVDQTLLASFEVKEYGEKKKRNALTNVDMKKFTSRKGKDPKVRQFVEKPKYRLDTKGEQTEISQARIRAETRKRIEEVKKDL